MNLTLAIIHMYGPHFLVLYGLTIAITLAGLHLYIRRCAPAPDTAVPPIPEDPNPHEVAFLRGGPKEFARLLVFELIQRGYLDIAQEKRYFLLSTDVIRQCAEHPSTTYLSPTERTVFDFFTLSRRAKDLFPWLPNALQADTDSYRKHLEEQQLLASSEYQASARFAAFVAAGIILGLGGVKLAAALSKGHSNVGFLILMAMASAFCVYSISRVERLTSLGKRYLEGLEGAFVSLKDVDDRTDASVDCQPEMLLAVGLFGVGVLSGTTYDNFGTMFQHAGGGVTGWTGGWVGGCGSGGCGGGCGGGGCGGGGCGGCGG